MSRSVVLAVICLGLQGTSAAAIDLTIRSSLSETIEANDNYFLTPVPKGMIYRPMSTIVLDAIGRTPDTRYALNTDLTYYKYLGPGAESMSETSGTAKGVMFNIDRSFKGKDSANFNVSWREQDIAPAQLADTGVATTAGQMSTLRLGGGFTRQASARDTFSLTAAGTSVDSTSATSSSFVALNTIGTWNHRLNPTNDLITLVDFNWTVRSDQSETKFTRFMTGVDSKLTPRVNLRANVGAGFIEASGNNSNVLPTATSSPLVGGGGGSAVGLLWDVLLSYQLDRTTRASLTGGQSVTPDLLGHYSLRKSVGVTVDRDINRSSGLNFSGNFTNFTSTTGTYNYFTASVAYYYRLTKDWNSTLSYTFRERTSDVDSASSNGVMLVLKYETTILPSIPRERQ